MSYIQPLADDIEEIYATLPMTGKLTIPMTNDYLFKALLQENEHILRGLICALLALKETEIESVVITNPIELGESFDDKTYILDILVLLNNNQRLNLEMQVINEHDWVERSFAYLCRTYDNAEKASNYKSMLPVHQIGLLNFSLFPDEPEFYAHYKFLNVRTHKEYSSKLRISVLDLTQTGLATCEDKASKLDYWAELFRAKTWEDIRMLAEREPIFKEVATAVKTLTEEEKIRMQCEAREDYYKTQNDFHNYYLEQLDEKDEEIAAKDETIALKEEALAQKDETIAQKDEALAQKDEVISRKDDEIAELRRQIEELRQK